MLRWTKSESDASRAELDSGLARVAAAAETDADAGRTADRSTRGKDIVKEQLVVCSRTTMAANKYETESEGGYIDDDDEAFEAPQLTEEGPPLRFSLLATFMHRS